MCLELVWKLCASNISCLPTVMDAEYLVGKERHVKQLSEYCMVGAIFRVCTESHRSTDLGSGFVHRGFPERSSN